MYIVSSLAELIKTDFSETNLSIFAVVVWTVNFYGERSRFEKKVSQGVKHVRNKHRCCPRVPVIHLVNNVFAGMLRRVLFLGTAMVWRMGGCPTHGRLICLYLSGACASTCLLASQHQQNNLTESRKPRVLKEKQRQKVLTWWRVVEWRYMQTHKWIMREEGRVVCLSMRNVFWRNISLLVKKMMWQKSERKAVESFALYVRYFRKER